MDTIRVTAIADVDLTGYEGYLVKKMGSDERVALCDADTDDAIGVIHQVYPGGIGAKVIVDVQGVSRMLFASTVEPFDLIAPDATGKGKTAATGDTVVGRFIPELLAGGTDLSTADGTGTYRVYLSGAAGYVSV